MTGTSAGLGYIPLADARQAETGGLLPGDDEGDDGRGYHYGRGCCGADLDERAAPLPAGGSARDACAVGGRPGWRAWCPGAGGLYPVGHEA